MTKHKIIASSKEGYERLEDRLKKFAEQYNLKGTGGICVEEGFPLIKGVTDQNGRIKDTVKISPDNEFLGKIEEVFPIKKDYSGTFFRSTPEEVCILIGETAYVIRYNHKSK